MATFNLFLNASQADSAITNSYNLFHPDGLTGQNISLYGGNINHWGIINSTQLYITGDVGEESFINRLTGGIRVEGDCEIESIVGGISIGGTSYIENLTGGLYINNGGINVVGDSVNNGSFRNVGSVSVTGPTSITGATRIVGNTDIRGNFFQSGSFDVISNDAEFRGNLDVTGTLDVNGPFAVNGETTITATGGFTVSGPTTVNGNSTLNGTTNIVGDLQLNGQPFVTQQINQITEVSYFLTGGECVSLLTGITTGQGAVIKTSNSGLIPRDEGPSVNGNTRGDYAVDLQLTRDLATQVAGGNNSALIGGSSNTVSGFNSAVIGGSSNTVSGFNSAVIGGSSNTVSGGSYNAIIGGFLNTGGGSISSIIGGRQNILGSTSDESCIIGGWRNVQSGTNNAIIGGNFNKMSYRSRTSTILGGSQNIIEAPVVWGAGAENNCSIIGGFKNRIGNSQTGYVEATIIGGSFGEVFNNSERVLSNPITNDAGTERYRMAQVSELVLPLHPTNGFFINGGSESLPNTGLSIPGSTVIAFKAFGAVNGGFVELKGTVTNSSFQLLANDVLNNNTITGGISTGSNTWFLNLVAPSMDTGTLYLEMVYAPFADPYEDPYGNPYGGFAFNADPSLGVLFS